MLFDLVTFLASVVASSLIGQLVHWALHQPWTGRAYKGHMQHHALYPPNDLTSLKYRKADWLNSGPFLFTPPFLFIVLVAGAIALLAGTSLWTVAWLAGGLLAFGLVNDYVHDSFHLEKCWMRRFAWYHRLQRHHFVHHRNAKRNLGIVTLAWDRLFGTFTDD